MEKQVCDIPSFSLTFEPQHHGTENEGKQGRITGMLFVAIPFQKKVEGIREEKEQVFGEW